LIQVTKIKLALDSGEVEIGLEEVKETKEDYYAVIFIEIT